MDEPTCSILCPCPTVAAFSNSNANLTQAKLIDWGRYVDVDSSNANIDYTKATQPDANTVSAKGLIPLYFAKEGASTKTYNTYKDCFENVLSKSST